MAPLVHIFRRSLPIDIYSATLLTLTIVIVFLFYLGMHFMMCLSQCAWEQLEATKNSWYANTHIKETTS